jgi:hypothetical protein
METTLVVSELVKNIIEPIPECITSIIAINNLIESLEFLKVNNRKWNNLEFQDNCFPVDLEISDITCSFLNLSQNKIKTVRFTNCIIDKLDLSQCNIETILFTSTIIKELDLSDNNIKLFDSFPNDIQILNLYKNKITEMKFVPETIQELNVSNNELINWVNIPQDIIKLELFNNKLEFIDPLLLKKCSKLIYLDISENKFNNMKELDKLDFETYYLIAEFPDDEQEEQEELSDLELDIIQEVKKEIHLIPIQLKYNFVL